MRRFPRACAIGLACLAIVLLTREEAAAHGGQFIPPRPPTPGGAIPRKTPRSNTPTEVTPGTGGPIVTPGGGFLKPGPVGQRKPEFTPTYEVSWRLWWELNRHSFLPRRPATVARAVVTPGPAPAQDDDRAAAWEARRAQVAKDAVVPFLLEVIDPASREDPDVVGSACLALGKIAGDVEVGETLLALLLDQKAPDLVRESAALGVGLLRRTAAGQSFEAFRLDNLRARLAMAWDRHVDGKRLKIPLRAREFALLSIGLLGDQPFQSDPQSKDGRIISQQLWQRYTIGRYKRSADRVALLAAIRLQPPKGIPPAVLAELEDAALGEKVAGRSIRPSQQAYALSAYNRLAGSRALPLLLRLLGDAKSPAPVRLAAAIALEERAGDLRPAERVMAVRLIERALGAEQEMLVMGLLELTLGRVLGADLTEGSTRLLTTTHAKDILEARAKVGPWYMRGFGVVALALAAREATGDDPAVRRFRNRALATLRHTLRDRTGEPELRAAAAVSLGLVEDRDSVRDLVAVVKKVTGHPVPRAHAAVALGQIGLATPEVKAALTSAALDDGSEELQGSAALGLSLLGDPAVAAPLLKALAAGRKTSRLAGVALALGHLGALDAADPLLAAAKDKKNPELVRAMAIVALGLLLDPEPVPSLSKLERGAPYPVRTRALEEAYTIL